MAIKEIQLPDGSRVVIDEWLHWPTYSVIEFAAASKVNLKAFTYVEGQRVAAQGITARSATPSDTNQTVKSQVNYDEALLVYSITYETFALSAATISSSLVTASPVPILSPSNLKRLQRDLMVELYVGARQQKPQFRAPFSFIGQGPGAPAFTPGDSPGPGAGAFAIRFGYGTGGWPTPENQRRLELPIYIQPTQAFNLRVYSPIAITDLNQNVQQRWYLDGIKRRPTG